MTNRLLRAARPAVLTLVVSGALLLGAQVVGAQAVSGVLVNQPGAQAHPIPEAMVQLCAVGRDECHTAYTDRNGVFRFGSITAGDYELRTESRSGDIGVSERLRVRPGREEVLRVVSP
jgi:hypothetical protein